MSIASEITSIGENLKKDYQAIANLGADLTNVDKNIENIAELLDGVYDNLPKTEYQEGTEVNLGVTTKGKLDYDNGVVGIGQTYQKSTTGINLCEAKMATATWHGVTFKNNGDGTFTINGTNDYAGNITFRINQSAYGQADNLQNYEDGNYTLDIGVSNSGMQATLMQNSTWHVYLQTPTNARLVSGAISGATNTFIYIAVPQGATINNVTIKPMLVKGSYTESTIPPFEQYTGGQASPNPSYPQEIKCVRGRNRWNGEYTRAYIDTDGSIVSSTNTLLTDYIDLDDNITISAKNNMFIVGVAYYNSSKTFISREQKADRNFKNITYSTPSNTKYIRVYVNLAITNFTDEDVENFKIQIEQGTQATPYLPYNTIEEVVSGINYANYSLLFNNTDCYSISNDNISLLQNDSRATTLIDGTTWGISLKKGTYTLYTSGTGISPQIQIIGKVIGQIARVNYSQLVTFNLSQDDIVAIKYLNTASFPINLGKVMIIEGTIANTPTYEPYITPTSYQLSLGDIQLNAIGNYKDELIYDVDEDKVYKNKAIGKAILKSDMNWSRGGTAVSGNARYYTTYFASIIKKPSSVSVVGDIMCNYYKAQVSASAGSYGGNQGIAIADTGTVYINDDNYADNLSGWTTWLDSVSCFFYYALDTEVLEEITDTTLINQVKALYNAHSLNGTTIITSNGNLPMIIKVRGLKGE